MSRLYSGYRGREYLSVRKRNEPWYSEKVNSSNLESGVISARKKSLVQFITPFLTNKYGKMTIADVGGNAGQFIPLELSCHAYVVEASDQLPTSGVTRVQAIRDIPHPINLVICAHVLEHIPSPMEFIKDIATTSNLGKDCLLYIEVPLERFRISPLLGHSLYRTCLGLAVKVRRLVIAVDFLSVLARSYTNALFPPLLLKLHEHINYYTVKSLHALVERAGLVVISMVEEKSTSLLSTHQGVIRLLAQRRPIKSLHG